MASGTMMMDMSVSLDALREYARKELVDLLNEVYLLHFLPEHWLSAPSPPLWALPSCATTLTACSVNARLLSICSSAALTASRVCRLT